MASSSLIKSSPLQAADRCHAGRLMIPSDETPLSQDETKLNDAEGALTEAEDGL